MTLDTVWGNQIVLSVETELDNPHELTTGELTRLQVFTLSLMVAEVRRASERALEDRETEEGSTTSSRERERFKEMEQADRAREQRGLS